MTLGHRSANRHPGLTLTADGISPLMAVEALSRSVFGSGSGFEPIKSSVYGCLGLKKTSSAGPTSSFCTCSGWSAAPVGPFVEMLLWTASDCSKGSVCQKSEHSARRGPPNSRGTVVHRARGSVQSKAKFGADPPESARVISKSIHNSVNSPFWIPGSEVHNVSFLFLVPRARSHLDRW